MRVPAIFRPRDPRSRHLHLLIWLVVYLLASAIAAEFSNKLWLMDLMFVGVLATTLRAVSRSLPEFIVAALVGGVAVAVALASAIDPAPHFLIPRSILGAVFTGFLSIVILREVIGRGAVDRDTILGAICAYLLVGICWAGIFGFMEQVRPGSIAFPEDAGGPSAARPEMNLYFSFVTLATLGYGDIRPTTPTTRVLAWMEAVFGQFYIAVLVARLVGLVQSESAAAGGRGGGRGGGAGDAGRRAAP
jgi:ion channel